MKFLHSAKPSDAGAAADGGAERAALTRLRIASNLSGGTPVREFDTEIPSGLSGWWFMLRLGGWRTRVADAVLSIRDSRSGALGAIEQFMQQANLDVARFSIVCGANQAADISGEASGRRRLWFFQANREYRDLLPLTGGAQAFLKSLGVHTRRNIRRTARIAEALGIRFSLAERSTAIEIDRAILDLAAHNRPAAVPAGSVGVFEQMLSYRPSSFDARITLPDGTLISLCRGFITGRTAYLVYQMNNPVVPGINLGLFQTFKVIEALTARGVTEAIFVMEGSALLKAACRVSSKEELITIRPSLRGVAMTALLAVALKGTRFGEALRYVLRSILRHWLQLPKLGYDQAVASVAPPGSQWPRAIAGFVGLALSVAAIGVGVLIRPGIEKYLPYITAYPAIIIATYLAGAWTGLATVALGGLGILYYVIPPYDSFALDTTADIVSTAIYVLSAFPLWRWFVRYTNSLTAA
jgi:hypothetical protein